MVDATKKLSQEMAAKHPAGRTEPKKLAQAAQSTSLVAKSTRNGNVPRQAKCVKVAAIPEPAGPKAHKSSKRSRSDDDTDLNPSGKSRREGAPKAQPRSLSGDFLDQANHTMVRLPFDASRYVPGIADHDSPNVDDVLEAPEYVSDIFQRLYFAEVRLLEGNYS
jgi:hypothetical protein